MIEPLRTGDRLRAAYDTAVQNARVLNVTFKRCLDEDWERALTLQQRLLTVGTGRFGRSHLVYGAFIAGDLVGFSATLASAERDAGPASHHLHSMGVDPKFRLNGIGLLLIELPRLQMREISGRSAVTWGGCDF